MTQNDVTREQLEKEADMLRSKFADTLDALDRRRHNLFNLKFQAKKHAMPLSAAGAGALLLAAGGIALAVHRRHQSPQYRFKKGLEHGLRALDESWSQSSRALSQNLKQFRKYWKKNMKELF